METTASPLYREAPDVMIDPIDARNWELALRLIDAWADEREISTKATAEAQANKTIEEAEELFGAVVLQDKNEIALEIGDVMVTLQIQARKQGLSLFDCLVAAYEKIKNRDGRMVGGQFVRCKDE